MQDAGTLTGTEAHLLSTETQEDWFQCAASTRLILPDGRFQVGRASDFACCSRSLVAHQHWNLLPDDHCLICRPLLPEGSNEDDVAFCNRITVEAGVTALPVMAVVPQHSTCVCFTSLLASFCYNCCPPFQFGQILIHGMCSGMLQAESCA